MLLTMIDKYNGGKVKYIGLIKIFLSRGGCNDMNVYTSDDNELYDHLNDLNYMRRRAEEDSDYTIDEFETDKYYLFNEQRLTRYLINDIYVFLKSPLTAAAYAELINYFDKVSTLDMREYIPRVCHNLNSMLKNRGFIATEYDERLINRFTDNREEVVDYEKYDITADELKDLFD